MLIGLSLALVGSSCEQPAEATRAQSITGSRWGKRITASEEATFCRGNGARRQAIARKEYDFAERRVKSSCFRTLDGAQLHRRTAVPPVCQVGPAVDVGAEV